MTIIAASVAHSRVEAGAGVLGLLYEAGHVLEEEVVHVLLVHVAQLRVAAHVHLQQHDGVNTDKYRGWYLWIGPAVLAAGSWSWCCVVLDSDGMVCRRLLGPGQCSHAGVRHLAVRRRLLPPLLRSSVVAFMCGQGSLGSSNNIYLEINVC